MINLTAAGSPLFAERSAATGSGLASVSAHSGPGVTRTGQLADGEGVAVAGAAVTPADGEGPTDAGAADGAAAEAGAPVESTEAD
jgi:hypothetical protein